MFMLFVVAAHCLSCACRLLARLPLRMSVVVWLLWGDSMGCFHAKVIGSSAWPAHGVAVMLLIGVWWFQGMLPCQGHWELSMASPWSCSDASHWEGVIPRDASMPRSLGAQHGQPMELQ